MLPQDDSNGLLSFLKDIARSLVSILIPFAMVVGGIVVAVWAAENDQQTLALIGFAVAVVGFIWLLILQMFYGTSLFGGDSGSFGPLALIGCVVAGCGAMAFMGFGLIFLAILALPILLIWVVFFTGLSFFE